MNLVQYTWYYVRRVAVVLSRTNTPAENFHAGIAHRTADDRVFVLHMAWDCDLKNQEFDGPNKGLEQHDPMMLPFPCPIFVVPEAEGFDQSDLEEQLDLIASLCRTFYEAIENRRITYTIGHFPEEMVHIDDRGVLKSADRRYGLNCVSLVIQVFNKAKLPLVTIETWPENRARDKNQQRILVDFMERQFRSSQEAGQPTTITREKIEFNRQQIGRRRVAPEEIAGACLEPIERLPADFATCEPRGRDIGDLHDRLRYSRHHSVPLLYVPSPPPPLNSRLDDYA
jgi:hypothetical protein